MAYTDFIAAIDLGSSHIVGMAGVKSTTGTISIIAHEVESSSTCIRRGCVYNVEETANKIKRLVLKLENKLQGTRIRKVYVGIGGQSLRSIDHTVPKILGTDGVVTEEVIASLYQECRNYRPDMLDVLAAVSPTYFLDDKPEPNPVGIPCNRIEARYKLIVGRPSLRRYVINSIAERAKIEIAGIIVSPLALSDAVLSDSEKDLGCALIGFGAGVTTLTVYKAGKLICLSVIPFGSNLITRDITSLHLVEAEAERVKKAYGSALMEKDSEQTIQVSSADGMGLREIKLADLNNVVEARVKEILENVYARLDETGLTNSLGAGIVVTGGAGVLKNLTDVIRERMKMSVRFSAVRKGIVENANPIAGNPEYAVAIGLLMKGSENCALYVPPRVVEPEPPKVEVKEEPKTVANSFKKKPEKQKKKGPSIFGSWKKNFDNMAKGLFDDEDDV
ncbi:MAG: cell division protein FtsA [Tannerellaceae bacterium]|nr:cell division protein FtsA [Tannerellaceae bacterium]MCD8265304.1 cell division protein FtsA [Tannerellaceae bacterium]